MVESCRGPIFLREMTMTILLQCLVNKTERLPVWLCHKLNSDLFSAGVGLRKSYPEYVYITLVFWAVKTLLEMRLCKFIIELPSEYQLSPDSKQILYS